MPLAGCGVRPASRAYTELALSTAVVIITRHAGDNGAIQPLQQVQDRVKRLAGVSAGAQRDGDLAVN